MLEIHNDQLRENDEKPDLVNLLCSICICFPYKLNVVAGRNMGSKRCVGINGNGLARTLMAMDLPTLTTEKSS